MNYFQQNTSPQIHLSHLTNLELHTKNINPPPNLISDTHPLEHQPQLQSPPQTPLFSPSQKRFNPKEDFLSHIQKQLIDAKIRLQKSEELVTLHKRLKEQQDQIIKQLNQQNHALKIEIQNLKEAKFKIQKPVISAIQNTNLKEINHQNQFLMITQKHRMSPSSSQKRRMSQESRRVSFQDQIDLKKVYKQLQNLKNQKHNLLKRLQLSEKEGQQRMEQMYSLTKQLRMDLEETRTQIGHLNSELVKQRMNSERLEMNYKVQLNNLRQINKSLQKRWITQENHLYQQKDGSSKQQFRQIYIKHNKEIQDILRQKQEVQKKLQKYRLSCSNFQKLLVQEKQQRIKLKKQCDKQLILKQMQLEEISESFIQAMKNKAFQGPNFNEAGVIDKAVKNFSKVIQSNKKNREQLLMQNKRFKEKIQKMKQNFITERDSFVIREQNYIEQIKGAEGNVQKAFYDMQNKFYNHLNSKVNELKAKHTEEKQRLQQIIKSMKEMLGMKVNSGRECNSNEIQFILQNKIVVKLQQKMQMLKEQDEKNKCVIQELNKVIGRLQQKIQSGNLQLQFKMRELMLKQEKLMKIAESKNRNKQQVNIEVNPIGNKAVQNYEYSLNQHSQGMETINSHYVSIDHPKSSIEESIEYNDNCFLKKKNQLGILEVKTVTKVQQALIQTLYVIQQGQQTDEVLSEQPQVDNSSLIKSLKFQLGQREMQHSRMLNQIRDLMSQHRNLQTQFSQFQIKMVAERQNLKRQNQELIIRLSRCDSQIFRLIAQVNQLKAQNKQQQKQNAVTMQIRNPWSKPRATQLGENTVENIETIQKNPYKDVQFQKQNLQKQILRLQNEILVKNQNIQALSQQNNQYKFSLCQSQNKLSEVLSQLHALKFNQQIVNSHKELIQALQNQIAQKNRQLSFIQENQVQNDNMKGKVYSSESMKLQLIKSVNLNHQLQLSLKSKNSQIDLLNKQLNEKDKVIILKKIQYQNMILSIKQQLIKEGKLSSSSQNKTTEVLEKEIDHLKNNLQNQTKAHQQQIFILRTEYQNDFIKERAYSASLQTSISNIMEEHLKVKAKYESSIEKLRLLKNKFFSILNGIKIVEGEIKEDLQGSALKEQVFQQELQLSQLSQSLQEMIMTQTKKHQEVQTTMKREGIESNKTQSSQNQHQAVSEFNQNLLLFTPPSFKLPLAMPPKPSK